MLTVFSYFKLFIVPFCVASLELIFLFIFIAVTYQFAPWTLPQYYITSCLVIQSQPWLSRPHFSLFFQFLKASNKHSCNESPISHVPLTGHQSYFLHAKACSSFIWLNIPAKLFFPRATLFQTVQTWLLPPWLKSISASPS